MYREAGLTPCRVVGYLFMRIPVHAGQSFRYIPATYARADLLTLDDWGLQKLNQEQRLDLLELLEERYGLKSTIVTAQVPIDHWPDIIGDPTLADAIMDRLVHNAYKIQMKGESMRKDKSGLT